MNEQVHRPRKRHTKQELVFRESGLPPTEFGEFACSHNLVEVLQELDPEISFKLRRKMGKNYSNYMHGLNQLHSIQDLNLRKKMFRMWYTSFINHLKTFHPSDDYKNNKEHFAWSLFYNVCLVHCRQHITATARVQDEIYKKEHNAWLSWKKQNG